MTAPTFGVDELCRCRFALVPHLRGQGVCPFPQPARARNTDPETSHAAALSVDNITESRRVILEALRNSGPMSDDELWATAGVRMRMSPSGARTRRSELVRDGFVKDSGRRTTTPAGRAAIVWAAVEGGS